MNNEYDIAIVGGGLIGISLALALAKLPLRIVIIDAAPKQIYTDNLDERPLALSYASWQIFKALNIYQEISDIAIPITKIHVSDRGHFGAVRISAKEENVPALGYVMPAHLLLMAVQTALQTQTHIEQIYSIRVTNYQKELTHATLTLSNNQSVSAKLVVASDGTESALRKLLRIPTIIHDYQQSAVVANVELARGHFHTAYERFTVNGPLAILPLTENYCGIVWTIANESVEEVTAYDDQKFLQELQKIFGYRLGRFLNVGQRQMHSLKFVRALEEIRPGLVLLGNAAHTLHPIAAQGFNLGLRDVAALSQVIIDASNKKEDLQDFKILQRYEQWRRLDHGTIVTLTDSLVKLFSNNFLPLVWGRGVGLTCIDMLSGMKNKLSKVTMGKFGSLPKLAC